MLFYSVFAITESGDMGLYEMPLSMSLLGFGIDTMLANFHMCGIMMLSRAVFYILVRNASQSGTMCFRCLMFNLSWPCEQLFLNYFIASWTWVVVSVMSCPCISLFTDLCVLCVACLTVFVNCLMKNHSQCVWKWLLLCCWMLWM